MFKENPLFETGTLRLLLACSHVTYYTKPSMTFSCRYIYIYIYVCLTNEPNGKLTECVYKAWHCVYTIYGKALQV